MIKNTVTKLYGFIAKLVILLEEELEGIEEAKKSKRAILAKKNITDMLNKLVALILQLNKLSRDESWNDDLQMTQGDEEIIQRFLQKYINE